ncbi:MAG: MerR family transcriptional regulator [Oscillospiraceae bacterium]|nr:MerR family transcriptional regulator [Oscillospiraceae bacterium]
MFRIGEVAKRFDISNRTLRYWEEMGILRSARTENGYRFYEEDNVTRIEQIVLLRKLKMPIAEIERIFMASDLGVAIDALSGHLENLKNEAAANNTLIALVESLISRIRASGNLKQVFACLEARGPEPAAPQISLSERIIMKNLHNVRIVKLPAMTVASYRAESAEPENDCSEVFNKFVLDNNLHKRDGYRFFGFNNPSPSKGNPVYGYEMWVTVPDDFAVPEPLEKKRFGGGLYASIPAHMNEIGERWQLLYGWCKNSGEYDVDFSSQWLEECSMDFETFISDRVADGDKQLDLLSPVKLK